MAILTLKQATQACVQLFASISASLPVMPVRYVNAMPPSLLEDEHERFKVWSGNLGARQGGHASLDWRLRDAETMSTSIRKLLQSLEDDLKNTLEIISQKRLPYEDQTLDSNYTSADTDSDGSEDGLPELAQRLQTITTTLKGLYKLSFIIRRPGTRVAPQKAALYRELVPGSTIEYGDAFHHFDRDHVVSSLNDLRKESFVSAPGIDVPDASQDPLTDRLANAITKRRRQFRYWVRHREKLAKNAFQEGDAPGIAIVLRVSGNQNGERPLIVPGTQMPGGASPQSQSHPQGPRTETEATKYMPIPFGQEDAISIAPSASTARDLEGHEATFPRPPDTDGRDFECPYCFVLCSAKEATPKRWRKHISEDLQPYLCTYVGCKFADQLYSSRTAWLLHEEAYHRQAWRCRDHRDIVFATEGSYYSHLSSLHPELTPVDIQAVIDLSLIAREDDRNQCPLCLVPVTRLRKGQNLLKHIANHLERISCFAFPRGMDLDDEMEDNESVKTRSDQSDGSQRLSDVESEPLDGEPNELLLYDAAWEGSIDLVRSLLQEGADVNAQGGSRGSALQAASGQGYEDIVQLLLSFGADVHEQGGFLSTALQGASEKGHEDVVRRLLDAGADVNAQGGHYGNALQAASYKGCQNTLQRLLDAGANVNAQGGYYSNSLLAAAYRGHQVIVQLLLDQGADINAQSEIHGNVLQAASFGGHEQTLQLLLSRGADVNARGGEGHKTALAIASARGHKDVVQLLLSRGANINAQGGEGHETALAIASARGHSAIVQLLLSKGADVNTQGGGKHVTALAAASLEGHEDIVQLLLNKGADINGLGGERSTALEYASRRGHKDIVQLLLANGARQ